MPEKVQYIKVSLIHDHCPQCGGHGKFEEKFPHNQYRLVCCYKCSGTGKVVVKTEKDVTSEIINLRNRVRRFKAMANN